MWASLHTLGVLIALISPTLADIGKILFIDSKFEL